MIKHYLKVALRNLMNFKVHSLISAICLAIGITCFSMMNYFIDAITGKVELSDNNKYSIRLSGASSQTAADIYLFKEDFDYLKELPIAGIDTLVALPLIAMEKRLRPSTKNNGNCRFWCRSKMYHPIISPIIRSN